MPKALQASFSQAWKLRQAAAGGEERIRPISGKQQTLSQAAIGLGRCCTAQGQGCGAHLAPFLPMFAIPQTRWSSSVALTALAQVSPALGGLAIVGSNSTSL